MFAFAKNKLENERKKLKKYLGRARTHNLYIGSPPLYQLSHA
jgi:hypothetical protein